MSVLFACLFFVDFFDHAAVDILHFKAEGAGDGGRFVDQTGVFDDNAFFNIGAEGEEGGLNALVGVMTVGGAAGLVIADVIAAVGRYTCGC